MSDLGPESATQLAPEAAPDPPQPDPPSRPWYRTYAAAALFCLAAAVLTGISALQVLLTVHVWFGDGQRLTQVITAWEMRYTSSGLRFEPAPAMPQPVPLNSVPLLVGAALLLVAAVLLAFGAVRAMANRQPGRAGALVAVVAAVFVVATVGNIALQMQWWSTPFREPSPDPGSGLDAVVGPGLWTALVAAVLAVAAAVVAWRAKLGPAEAARVEPDTPVLGIPVLVHRLPDAPPDDQR